MTSDVIRSQSVDEVIILGAGFSKEINQRMPTADELGDLAANRAGLRDVPRFVGGRFETWLSRLAEYQPDLTASQNAQNAATFARLVEAIHGVMVDAQDEVDAIPDWMARLITALHYRRSTVVTFNYDTLVERATESLNLWDFALGGIDSMRLMPRPGQVEARTNLAGRVGWHSLINDVPPLPPPFRSSETLPPSFRLLKLHGSLNWYWVPGDSSGATLNSWHLLKNDVGERRRYLPGREPFVVPPAATKSPYFGNPIMRETWSTAGAALKAADIVCFVGYSLPTTDLLSTSMIADGLAGREPQMSLINRAPADPLRRLKALTRGEPVVVRSIPAWSESVVEDTSRRVADQLAKADGANASDTLLTVGWHPGARTYVSGLSTRNGVVILSVADATMSSSLERNAISTVADLVPYAADAQRIVARFGKRESTIVGIDAFGQMTGPAERHQVLIPADPPDLMGFPAEG